MGKREIAHNEQFLLFPVFSTLLENFLPITSNSKYSSAISFSLEKSKICSFWERINPLPNSPMLPVIAFENILEKDKCCLQAFSPLPKVFHQFNDKSHSSNHLSAINVFNIEETKILSC